MNCFNYIKSDLYRYSGDYKLRSFVKQYLFSEGFKYTVWLRICFFSRKNRLTKKFIFPIAYLFYRRYKYKFGYDISYNTEIGPGLLIFHISNIVISANKIGKNFTISQGCTVGMIVRDKIKEYPTIGDNVYMAPGSKIIGGVYIGDNVAVGTNCVLNKSVNENAVVVGIPGREISYKGSGDYTNNVI